VSNGPIIHILSPGIAAAALALATEAWFGNLWATGLAAAVGAIAGALPLLRDAAELERTAAKRREDERRASVSDLPVGTGRVLLERLPQGVLVVAPDARVIFINARARRVFGGLPDRAFAVAALRVPSLLEATDGALRAGAAATVEFTLTRGTELNLVAHVVPLADEAAPDAGPAGPLGALIVIEDQTRARRAEQLHRDFVANASHELKTPLAAVSAIIETLTGHARDDEAAQERFLGMMAAQTERMKALVEDLISLNRIEINERMHPEAPHPVLRILHGAIDSLRPHAEASGMRIVAPAAADAPLVPADREELSQVFVNLIENALRYGKPAPEVRVRLIENDPDRPGMIGIAVEDDGPGIAREHLPRLTERFYRVSVSRSRERGGTGLGLAIVKHILNRHRGQLGIESTPGKGSRFTAWLPLATPEAHDGTGRSGTQQPDLRLAGE
jgi:two-component system phosphate regulon sensor histidine kinase PhoR